MTAAVMIPMLETVVLNGSCERSVVLCEYAGLRHVDVSTCRQLEALVVERCPDVVRVAA